MAKNKKTRAKKNNPLSKGRKAKLQSYHIYLPHSTINKDALNEIINFAQIHCGYVQALYDLALPEDITDILNDETFQALKSIPAYY